MIRFLTIAALCASALATRGDDDEVRFKPKTYKPSQTLRDSTYRETIYAPASSSQPVGKRLDTSRAPSSSRWRLFGRDRTLDAKKLEDVPAEKETAYKQEKQISVPTIKADPRDIVEKKPFEDAGKKLTDASYQKKEGPRAKDPLLKPHQGIKEPE